MTKQEKLWLEARAEFLHNHPPNFQGYYVCTYCRVWIPEKEVTVDHIISRSRAPHLRYVQSNLCISCWDCNTRKGSGDWLSTELPVIKLDDLPFYY